MGNKRRHIGQKAIKPQTVAGQNIAQQTAQKQEGVKTVAEQAHGQMKPQTAQQTQQKPQTEEKKAEVNVEVKKVEVNHNAKIKRNLTLSVKNDNELELLSDKVGIPKSKIVDILLSKFLKLEINDEFDVYDVNISK